MKVLGQSHNLLTQNEMRLNTASVIRLAPPVGVTSIIKYSVPRAGPNHSLACDNDLRYQMILGVVSKQLDDRCFEIPRRERGRNQRRASWNVRILLSKVG